MRVRRAALYLRISDDREGQGLGVQRQEKDGRALAASLNAKVVAVYVDNDVSAYGRKKRKDYERMLADLPTGAWELLIAWDPDRLHRKPKELERFIDLVERSEVEVHTCKAGRLDLSTPAGRAVARTLGAWARYESEHKSERIRRKVEELVADGKPHNGGPRPFGYARVYDGEGPRRKILRDELHPVEAPIVVEMVRRALEGESLYALVKDLNARGILTSTGRAWTAQALRWMLISGRIAGLKEHHRQVVGPASWPAIITVKEHKELRALLTLPHRLAGTTPATRTRGVRKHLLSGLVYCSCDSRNAKMRVQRSSSRAYLSYTCPSKAEGGCGSRAIKVPDLERLVERLVLAHLEEIEAAEGNPEVDARRGALEGQLRTYEARLEELSAEFSEGELSARDLRTAREALTAKIETARHELAELGVRTRVEASAEELRRQWADPAFPMARKRVAVATLVEKIVIYPATQPYSIFSPDRVDVLWR